MTVDALSDEFWQGHRCCSCAADGYPCCATGPCPTYQNGVTRPPLPAEGHWRRRKHRKPPKPRATARPRRRPMPS